MQTDLPHPSHFIDTAAAATLRQYAAEAEKAWLLHPLQLAEIYANKWFLLFVPQQYGGLELSVVEGVKIEEGLAWADGSTAWVVTLCSGANWFSGFLAPALAGKIFSDPKACLAGSGQPSGTAVKKPGGYLINGYWNYNTGAPFATAFTANCVITEKNGAATNVRAFLFLKEEVTIHKTWRTIGLQATASESFSATHQLVGEERSFIPTPIHARVPSPLYQYPFLQLAEATLAANNAGMANRFMDLCAELLQDKKKNKPGDDLVKATEEMLYDAIKQLQLLRQAFYVALHASWESCIQKNEAPEVYTNVSNSSRLLANGARRMVDELYPLFGMKAADPSTEINRVWRNLHTASQHSLLRQPVKH